MLYAFLVATILITLAELGDNVVGHPLACASVPPRTMVPVSPRDPRPPFSPT